VTIGEPVGFSKKLSVSDGVTEEAAQMRERGLEHSSFGPPSEQSVESDSADWTLKRALNEIDALSMGLSIPVEVTDQAVRMCRSGLERGMARRKTLARFAAASLYAACRASDVPTTLDDVAAASGVTRKDLASCYRRLIGELDLKIPVAEPAEYVARVASKAKASAEVQAGALEILSRAEKAGVTGGSYPCGLAASALYVAAALAGEKLTQQEVAGAAGVREATIRMQYRRLVKVL
jgi:transcription initiation factor TFIIB